MFNGRKTNKHLVPLRSHSSFLQRSNTVIVFNVSILICMAMRKRKESHLANLSGSLQGMKVATRFGSIPVTQIPASCESFRKRLAIVPWGFRSIFKRKRLWSWPSGNQRRGGVGATGTRAVTLPVSLLTLLEQVQGSLPALNQGGKNPAVI